MAEDFNIRLGVDLSEGRAALSSWRKELAETIKFGDRLIQSSAQKSSQLYNFDKSISRVKQLTAEIAKLKKAAGDVDIKVQDSETSLAAVVQSSLKKSKAKGSTAKEIKALQKELEGLISAPADSYKELSTAVVGMRKIVAELRKPNPNVAKEYAQTRRELDLARRELIAVTRQMKNSGGGDRAAQQRYRTLSADVPKLESKLKKLDQDLKPTGEIKSLLDTAEKSLSRGMTSLERIGMALSEFSAGLEETTTGYVQGAGQDLLSGRTVRSIAKASTVGGTRGNDGLVQSIVKQVVGSIVAPRMQTYRLSPAEQAKLQGKASIRAYREAQGAGVDRDPVDPTGVMNQIMRLVVGEMYPKTQTGTGTAVVMKEYGDALAKIAKEQSQSSSAEDEEDLADAVDSLTQVIADAFEEMQKTSDEETAAQVRGRRGVNQAESVVKEAFSSMSVTEGDPDREANRKELESWVRARIRELSFGARGGQGGRRIGGTFVPTTWQEGEKGLEKVGGYEEGGWQSKDMNKGFFAVNELTAMQEGFQYATITAEEFADALVVAFEVLNKVSKQFPEARLSAYSGGEIADPKHPIRPLEGADLETWLKRNPQGLRQQEGDMLRATENIIGNKTVAKIISDMIDITNRGALYPNIAQGSEPGIVQVESFSEDFFAAFKKLSPGMQEFVGLVEDFAIVTGKIKASIGGPRGTMAGLGLGSIDPELNTLEQLFSGVKTDPTTTIKKFTKQEWTAMHGTPKEWTKRWEGYTDSQGQRLYDPIPEYPKQEGTIYSGKNYPGEGYSLVEPLFLKMTRQLSADFSSIFGGDMFQRGKENIKVDPRTFRPSTSDDAVEMKAIDAFIENRRAFINYIIKATNGMKINDITMALPNVEAALDAGSMGQHRGSGATGGSFGEINRLAASYRAGHTNERSAYGFVAGQGSPYPRSAASKARSIFGGTGAFDSEQSGEDTVEGIRKGMQDGTPAVAAESKVVAQTIVGAYEKEMGIQSPSKRMRKAGQDTIAGLEEGLSQGQKTLDAEGRKLADSFHRAFTEEERANAALRVQELEKQGLTKPAAALRASMSTAPQRTAASETRPSTKQEIAERNKESERLIRELARTADAIIAWDVESSQEGGVFGYGMVGGTGAGDIRGIGHNMVVPPNFKLNRHEGEVLGLKSVEDLKKRIAAAGYDVERNTNPQAQRNMIEDIMHLIQVAIDANVPIAMHNIGFSDFNSLQKMAKQYGISGAPARQARDKGLLIETQALGTMLGMNMGPDGKPVSMKNEDVYQRLTGQAFGPQLIPGSGVVRQYKGKDAVAHDPTIDAAGTLVVAAEQYKRIKGTTQKVVGFLGNLIDTTTATVQDISGILFGWKNKTGKKTDGVALSYKGFDNSYTGDRPEPREQKGTRRSAAKAMAQAQQDANKATRLASEFDRLTKEERKLQIEQRLDQIEELKARLKALLFKGSGVNTPAQNRMIKDLQGKINEAMAEPTIREAWTGRLNATGGVRSGFGGGGSGNQPPVSGSSFDQNMEAEAKARAVASKKIQGQMKDEMSVMAQVERHNRKMMDSWISGRYALYDMANTYQQFTRAGMRMATYLRQAVMLNAQYETSFTGVERVMQPLSDEIAGMRKELTKLTTEIPVAFDELSRISTLAGQMGINASAITEFTKEVSQFGTVTGIATDEVAAKFGSIAQLTHTATDPEGFKKLGSAVAYTGINAVATDQEILSLTESIASATTQAGFAAEQTIGLATAMSSLRIAPEQARGVITRLFGDIDRAVQGGGQPMQAYAKHLGMTAEKAKALWEADPQAFFTKMLENVKNSKNSTMALDALNIKETREVNTIQKLSENLDVYNSSMADAAEAYKNGTFLAEAYGKSQDNVATKITLLSNQFKLFQDALGEALGPFTEKALEIVTGVLDGLTKISENPVGSFAVKAATALSAMFATFVAGTMLTNKATASMLAFRTANLALAKMGGGESGIWGFIRQITGQEVLLARSNGRVEVLTRKRRKQLEALGEIQVVKKGSQAEQTILSNIAAERGQMASTEDIIAQKGAYVKATLDETNQDRISTLQKENNTKARIRKALGLKAETAATVTATSAEMADARANMASTAAIEAEIVVRQRKIAALAAENVQLQASIGISSRDVAATQAQIAANNAETVSIEAQIAALQARNATSTKGPEQVAVIGKDRASGFGGIVGKIGAIGAVASVVVGIFAGISEAIEGTKVNLEEAGGGLASFREAIYADTRAWQESGEAFSTYDSKVTTSKETLNGWATDLQKATGATGEMTAGMTETTDSVKKQTLALSENSAAWLANAAMADTNVQDMFKKFYTVSGPGLGDMAAAAGTKISDIIKAALTEPGTGALAYVEENFNMFAASLNGKGSEVKAALIKIAESLDVTTAAGVENSKMVKALNEGFKETGDEAGDLSSNLNQVAERVRTLTDYTGDLSSIMSSAFSIRYGKTEAIDKLTGAWQQLRDKIKQAREEIANIQRDINGMQADANILQYQLNIAIKYGDTKRADKLRADLAAKQQEISDKNAQMVKAQGEASTSLVGNTQAAVDNRATLRGLVQDYNAYLAALANTAQYEGLSDKEVKRKKDFLKAQADQAKKDLITLAAGLGFKENELAPYVKSIDDFKTIVDKLPKELTLKVVADPATRAFMEWWAQNKGNFNPTNGATTGGTGTSTATQGAAATKSSADGIKKTPFSKLPSVVDVSPEARKALTGTTASALNKVTTKELENFNSLKKQLNGIFSEQQANISLGGNTAAFKNWKSSFTKFQASKKKLQDFGFVFKGQDFDTSAPRVGSAESVAGQAARTAAIEAQPAIIKEAITFLKRGLTSKESDNKNFEATKKPFAEAKQRMGLAGDTAWSWILENKKGQKHVDENGEQVDIIQYLTPYQQKFQQAWDAIKQNTIRGLKYRDILDATYSKAELSAIFGDAFGVKNIYDNGWKFKNAKPGVGWHPDSVRRYATGGYVSGFGSGTSDSVAARLSNGEFVMQASAVKAYGPAFMNALNQQQVMPRYALAAATSRQPGAQVVYLSPEDRNLLRAAIDRPVNLYTDNARIAQSANAGNVLLAQRGRN